MAILTVGTGQAYTTIAAAVAASSSGDTIDVMAGTYTNDFANIFHNLTVQAIGGAVNLVATTQPPNGKAIIDEGGFGVTVTLNGLTFSGATVDDGNGAGIRYEAGTLVLNNDTFTGNQEGLLGAPDPNGVITVTGCTFNLNGSGTGYTHNLYVGSIASLTVQNSTVENAIVGHDIKSRAAVNTITGNTITDTSGSASYEIDITNGGVATISGNVIEKGTGANNPVGITYGEEGGAYGTNSLTVTANTIVNDNTAHQTTAVRNSLSGVTATVSNNTFYGWNTLVSGAATQSNNTVATTEPALKLPTAAAAGVAPTIKGTVPNQVTRSEAARALFSGVAVGDANSGATDTLTVTLGGAGGTLSGAGTATGGAYTLTGTAAAITAQLDAVTFTPRAGAVSTRSTTTFALSLASSATATPVMDAVTSVIDVDPPAVTITAPAAGARLSVVDPTLTGTADLAEAGNTVTISNTGTIIGSAVVAADGTWSDHLVLPGDGSYALTASVINAAGDAGKATDTFVVDSAGNAAMFGTVAHDATGAAGDVSGLYQAILGRKADALGLESSVASEQNGATTAALAQNLLASAEYAAGPGTAAQTDAAFVGQLYANGLHRTVESGGLAAWTRALANGTTRAQVAVAVATSAESRADMAPMFQTGVYVPDAADASVARLYYGLLGRAPDAAGLGNWKAAAGNGKTVAQIAQGFLDSQEYAVGHGGLSNADFVNALCQNALGQAASGNSAAQGWIGSLAAGASRAAVAMGIAESGGASVYLMPAIENGFRLT